MKTFEAVTILSTPEVWAVLDVSDAGPCAKPPGRAGVQIVLFGVWSVITGWPIVQGAFCIVTEIPPVNAVVVTLPPMPKPAFVVAAIGRGMFA